MEAQTQPKAASRRVLAVLAGGLIVVIAFVALSSAPTQNEATTATSELYSIAGFKVTRHYKCIDPWKRCTDFWCDANCNHRPSYCPGSFCRGLPAPRPPPPPPPNKPPPPPPPPPPTCPANAKMQAPVYDKCPSICTSGDAKNADGSRKLTREQKLQQTKGANEGMVTTDQCANCFCSGCEEKQFKGNCADKASGAVIRPTAAACSGESCCPATCLGGVNQIREKMCTNCMCGGCTAAFFGNNCGGVVPDKCDVSEAFANEKLHGPPNMGDAATTATSELIRAHRGHTRRRRLLDVYTGL